MAATHVAASCSFRKVFHITAEPVKLGCKGKCPEGRREAYPNICRDLNCKVVVRSRPLGTTLKSLDLDIPNAGGQPGQHERAKSVASRKWEHATISGNRMGTMSRSTRVLQGFLERPGPCKYSVYVKTEKWHGKGRWFEAHQNMMT
jgi:hypothetical protein